MKNKILFLLIFFAAKIGVAQTAATNAGVLYISNSGDIFHAAGDFTNNSGAALTNNGQLYIKGNLSNSQSSMAVGSGTLFLNGTTLQTVSGAQVFKTYNLQTNNSAGFLLDNNLSVTGLHTYTSGLIATSATPNYLVYEAGSSYTGTSDTRHVTGWVKKMGNTNFTFPVGNNTYMRTAAISNLSATSEINCHYFSNTQNIYNLTAPLVQVNPREYWQVNKISGGNAQVTLNWDNSKVAFDNVLINEIRVAHYNGSTWTSAGGTASGNVTTTGTITSNALTSFSPFTFGYESYPVPLKLISFTAERRSGVSYLHWVTDNEENVNRFDIQRSNDGTSFATIGNLPARNTSFQEHYYYEDRSPIQGIAYYRVKSLDNDGKYIYTKIVAVTEGQYQGNSFIVVNPVKTVITVINKSGFDGLFDYRIFNAGGQLLSKGNVTISLNGNAVFPVPGGASGMYILELSNSRTNFRQKILVEK